jgi:hypothetical protein
MRSQKEVAGKFLKSTCCVVGISVILGISVFLGISEMNRRLIFAIAKGTMKNSKH